MMHIPTSATMLITELSWSTPVRSVPAVIYVTGIFVEHGFRLLEAPSRTCPYVPASDWTGRHPDEWVFRYEW